MSKETALEQIELNERLASTLEKDKIHTLQLISLGNSIATGYSMSRSSKPLLLRNETIEEIMKNHGITLTRKQFSRGQNNNDEHILEWLQENVTEEIINEWNRKDFAGSKHSLITHGLTPEMVASYYPEQGEENRGIQDILSTRDKDTANIVIYNGCTGSFLDGITRRGAIHQQLFHGVNRDVTSMHAILKWMQNNNRRAFSNIETYLCGVPNIGGVGVSELINHQIKRASQEYANTTYVTPIKTKGRYPLLGEDKKGFDVHYDEEEYQRFINQILKTIIKNHSIRRALMNLDRRLYELSKEKEFFSETSNKELEDILLEEMQSLREEEKIEFLKYARKYILSRFPYDFYYLGKEQVKKAFQKAKNK